MNVSRCMHISSKNLKTKKIQVLRQASRNRFVESSRPEGGGVDTYNRHYLASSIILSEKGKNKKKANSDDDDDDNDGSEIRKKKKKVLSSICLVDIV